MVAAELAVAPVTLACTVVIIVTARIARWPPSWLLLPALIGIGWAVLEGPVRAAEGFATSAVHVCAYLDSPGSVAAHLVRLPAELSRWRSELARQFPVALIAAAAQVALGDEIRGRIAGRGPLRRASAAATEGPYRLGLCCAMRRVYVTATLLRGELATTDGACLGMERSTGRRAAVSWAEAARGVLVTGDDQAAVTMTGLDLAVAAIQHRKAVIVVDLSDDPGLIAAAIAEACADRRALLLTWPETGSTSGAADTGRLGPVGSVGLDGVLARREVFLFQPGLTAPAAAITRMVVAELVDALAGRRVLGVAADGLVWFNCCEQGDMQLLDELVASAKDASLPLVLGTSAGSAAGRLAGRAGVIAVRGRPPRDLPDALPTFLLNGTGDDDLSLLVRGSVPRRLARCRAVRIRRYRTGGSR